MTQQHDDERRARAEAVKERRRGGLVDDRNWTWQDEVEQLADDVLALLRERDEAHIMALGARSRRRWWRSGMRRGPRLRG